MVPKVERFGKVPAGGNIEKRVISFTNSVHNIKNLPSRVIPIVPEQLEKQFMSGFKNIPRIPSSNIETVNFTNRVRNLFTHVCRCS